MKIIKEFVGFIKGLLLGLLKKKADTVEGVTAIYENAIYEAEEKYDSIAKKRIDALGSIEKLQKDITEGTNSLEYIKARCEILVKKGDIEEAKKISSLERKPLEENLSYWKEQLVTYQALDKELEFAYNSLKEKLRKLELDKEKDVNAVYLKNQVNEIYKETDPNRYNGESDRLLKHVQTNVRRNAEVEISGNKKLYGDHTPVEEKDEFIESLIAKNENQKES